MSSASDASNGLIDTKIFIHAEVSAIFVAHRLPR
jgi:hypothetical protein